ncbi:MAG: AAA family ATPase [Nitrospirota bacterium]|nr:AAA family ATPase [Nitrospirota bacterium]
MRLDRIAIKNYPPIRALEIEASSNVVIIAGANGSGKTRLKQAIVSTFQSPGSPSVTMGLSATRQEEEDAWKSMSIAVNVQQRCQQLEQYLASRRGNQAYTGAVIQIDSNRAVQPVRFEQFTLATPDPDDQDTPYSWYLNPFIGRWQELVNKIYKKAANRDQKIANFIKAHPDRLGSEALLKHPDPFLAYQEMFTRLLPGKTLEPIDPKAPREFHYRIGTSQPMAFGALSSGEQEVVKIAFDLVWKQITHSIILIDEPELHLHPTLAFRLIETLKDFGGGTNQLILFTHSADLISTYYSAGNVFFIDAAATNGNQAHKLSSLNDINSAVTRSAGANLGLFAVGKRLVFIEGNTASIDRLVYHKVAQTTFPDSYLMPIGSVENIIALRSVIDELGSAIFGIELFLVRDRDGLSNDVIATLETNKRFKCLPARHVENYFLDEHVLSEVAKTLYLPTDRRDPSKIRETLVHTAASSLMPAVLWNVREHIRLMGALPQPTVRNIDRLSIDEVINDISSQVASSFSTISSSLSPQALDAAIRAEHERLRKSLESDAFKLMLPGKLIFNRFCGEFFQSDHTRIREAYVDIAMKSKPQALQDVVDIFTGFSAIANNSVI